MIGNYRRSKLVREPSGLSRYPQMGEINVRQMESEE